jgi:hypothetical protein
MKTLSILTVLARVSLGLAAALFAACGSPAGEDDDVAVTVNGAEISKEDVERAVTAREQFFSLSVELGTPHDDAGGAASDRNAVVDDMIEGELFDQESRRRGIACSDAEVQQTQRENFLASGEAGLLGPVSAGFAPLDYFDTPVAERTPDVRAIIEAYLSDRRALEGLHRACRQTKLIAEITAAPPDPRDNTARNKAIYALEDELRLNAAIIRAPGY